MVEIPGEDRHRGAGGGSSSSGESKSRFFTTFSEVILTTFVSSWTTRSIHLMLGSFSLAICFFTMASKAMSGVKRPTRIPERASDGWKKRCYVLVLLCQFVGYSISFLTIETVLNLMKLFTPSLIYTAALAHTISRTKIFLNSIFSANICNQ